MKNNIFKSRRFKHGSLATVMTVGMVAILVLINVLVNILSNRFAMDVDLTDNQIFEISETTTDYLDTLDKDIEIYVLAAEDDFEAGNAYYKQASEVIKRYARYSDHITVEYIDTYTNPDFVNQYTRENFTYGDIIVQCGERYKVLTGYDIFETSSTSITASKAEQAMTSAIMIVADENPVTVTVLTGYGEIETEELEELLTNNGYLVNSANLMTEEIPEDTSFVILASPTADLDELAVAKLDAFLNNDGNYGRQLLYFASPSQPELPMLEAFLAEWGLTIGDGYLVESDENNIYYSPLYFVQEYGSETYTEGISTSYPVLMPYPRPVEILFETDSTGLRSTEVLLSTSDTAVVRPSDAADDWDITDGEQGTYVTAAVGTEMDVIGTTPVESKVIVFGSYEFMQSTFTSMEALNNAEYLLNVVNICTGKDEVGVQIVSKTLGTASLGISAAHVSVLGTIFQYILPAVVMVIGIVIWILRRNK